MIDTILGNPLLSTILYLVALVTAISIHEFSHALAADRLGDPTPSLQGRLTLNPKAHLDLYGSLIFLFLLLSRFPFVIGWGKPVQYDPFNLRNPRRDAAIISFSGPGANLLLAIVCSILIKLSFLFGMPLMFTSGQIFVTFLEIIIIVNVSLAVFNLIPIHPLDGFAIVEGFLPHEQAIQWHSLKKYGLIFLLLLIFPLFGSSPLSNLISPVINLLLKLLIPGTSVV